MSAQFDVGVVGGGIVGLATAYQLSRTHPHLRLVLCEKEDAPAAHQTGHNSGVIHSGLYYRPGSAKAATCVRGGELLKAFCDEHDVPYDLCGKVVVATADEEIPRLEELHRRGTANGVPELELIGPERLREIEPHVTSGLKALHVPRAGIIDYARVARALADEVRAGGGDVRFGVRVQGMQSEESGVTLETTSGPVGLRYVINCAGLHSDRVARLEGASPDAKIVPFRGEYYKLAEASWDLVQGLIYPVPDPRFPFLGVHFTRMIQGGVEAGPNAVLALAREGYRKRDINLKDLFEVLTYGGFWRLAARHWRMGWDEIRRSYSKRLFVAALARLVPEIQEGDLVDGGAGVRAQALSPDGSMVDDFLFAERPRALHVLNAPSPAATASLAIGEQIVERAADRFDLTPPAVSPGA